MDAGNLLSAHVRILRRLDEASADGVVASELVPERAAREFVLRFLSASGFVMRQKRFRGERIFITKKGATLIYRIDNGHDMLPD